MSATPLVSSRLGNDARAGAPRVDEDRATKTPTDLLRSPTPNRVESETTVIARVESCLPIVSDLVRGDVVLFVPSDNIASASARAIFRPSTVPSIGAPLGRGDRVGRHDEPDVIRTLTRGTLAQRVHRARDSAPVTIQDVYPILDDKEVVGALSIEIGLGEYERLQRTSVIYRQAIERLRRHAATAAIHGASNLSRLGEYDGPMIVTAPGQILYVSPLAEQLYRKVGCIDNLLHRNLDSLGTDESLFARAVESGTCLEDEIQVGPFTWRRRAIPLLNDGFVSRWSRVIRQPESRGIVILTVHDVTNVAQHERELRIKSAMIQEIHHRVKNNLQTVAALLRLQARRTGSPEVSGMLQQTISRILSIAYVHDFLAHQDSNEVDMSEVAQQIISEVTQGLLDPAKRVHITLDSPRIHLSNRQATSCALVLNELLHNTVEHAFPQSSEGNVLVRLSAEGNRFILEVSDDGQGLPTDFDPRQSPSLGLQIVQTLVRDDLKGAFLLVNGDHHGARGIVTFPRAD